MTAGLLLPPESRAAILLKRNMTTGNLNQLIAAQERAELYFATHPGSPSAIKRPSLSKRSGRWIATCERYTNNCIVGLGASVESALRAFDARYVATLRSPMEHFDRAA
jgi:hypothetical protein